MKQPPKNLNMELVVQLQEDGSSKIVDWITGQDITDLVYKIVIEPTEAKAYLYRVDKAGHFYIQGDSIARYHQSFPVVKIYGKTTLRRK